MHIYTGSEISFHGKGEFNVVDSTHPKFEEIVKLCYDGKYQEAAALVSVREAAVAFVTGSSFSLRGETVLYKGEKVPDILATRILEIMRAGLSVETLARFTANLFDNPSKRAVDELYGFLESSRLPITEDGHFLAYKSVTRDFKDHHTRTMDNSVGAVVSMPRNRVDEDKDRTCSSGLHFAAHEYAKNFGSDGRMVVVKINPRDVVAIPSDYNNQKGRCCRYEVIEEVSRDDTKLIGASVVVRTPAPSSTPEAPPADPKSPALRLGDRVVINARGVSEYGARRTNPIGVEGEVIKLGDWVRVRWDNTAENSYGDGTLNLVSRPYVPQLNNYRDRKLWGWASLSSDLIFKGEACDFPVNRKTKYSLSRKSNGKRYASMFFVNYDEKHDNLVFKKFNGVDFDFCTVKDLSDWTIAAVDVAAE